MKLDNKESKIKTEDVEVTRQAKKQTEYSKVSDHLRVIDGGRIWKVDKITGEVSEALYRVSEEISIGEIESPSQKIDLEPGYHYVEALNKSNAAKKVKQHKIIITT
jgi:hypothetical protein